jgi:hypothetical protein
MPQATYQDTPTDTLGSRITQLKGVVNAIQNTYDDESNGYMMPDPRLYDAMWAVVELIDQAEAAFHSLIDEQGPAKPSAAKGGAK